jgi:hypothetical protein
VNRLLVGFPLYHWTPANFFIRWLHMDKAAVCGCVTVNGAYITKSCETIVEQALAVDGWDRLVILEHDMLPPPDALARIAHYTPEQAIVGATYFRHEPPHTAIVYVENDGCYDPITPQTVNTWCEAPMLYRCDAVGFGLISIARHVLENWDRDIPMFNVTGEIGSHDLWFCSRAREQGHLVYVDTGVMCEHLTETRIGLSHNQAAQLPDGAVIKTFNYA